MTALETGASRATGKGYVIRPGWQAKRQAIRKELWRLAERRLATVSDGLIAVIADGLMAFELVDIRGACQSLSFRHRRWEPAFPDHGTIVRAVQEAACRLRPEVVLRSCDMDEYRRQIHAHPERFVPFGRDPEFLALLERHGVTLPARKNSRAVA